MATDYFTMMRDVVGGYGKGVDIARDRQYQDEKRARETTEYDQRQSEYNRALGLQRKSDDAYANLDSVSAGVVDPGATGLSQPSAQMLSQGYGGAKGPQAVQDAAGDYTREANRMGMAPQGYNAQAPVTQRKASDREMLDAEMGVATATRDRGYRESLRAKGKELDWNDGRLTHGKAWDAMTEAQRAEMVTKASLDANVPGSGTWVAGEGKRAGYMWYTPPGKDPVQLSAKEAKEVFILGNLASVNPERARKETEAASDKVRAVYGHLFDSQTKGVTANNTAQSHLDTATNTREYQQGMLGLRGQEIGIQRDRVNASKKEAPNPELVAKYNELMIQSEEATDPKVRAELDQKMRRVAAQISTGMGKPMQVRSEGRAGAPFSPIEEAGKGLRDNATGAIKYADGEGGYVAKGGVMPQDRAMALKKAKVPDNLIGQLPWNADGTSVGFAGQAYKVNDPEDMRALAKDYARLNGNAIAVDEAQKMDNHYMNNPAKTYGRSGSIYDTPEQRAAHTRAYDARNQ